MEYMNEWCVDRTEHICKGDRVHMVCVSRQSSHGVCTETEFTPRCVKETEFTNQWCVDRTEYLNEYRVAKTHRMPYLVDHFPQICH